jgi:hypothetical protein
LLSLFPDQAELDLEFVSQDGEEAVEPIISKLVEWAVARQDSWPGGRNSLQYSAVADHADECMEQLDILMADCRDRSKPTLWPFIKLIRSETSPPQFFRQFRSVTNDNKGIFEITYSAHWTYSR